MSIKLSKGLRNLPNRVLALNSNLSNLELGLRPPCPRVDHHIVFSLPLTSNNQTDALRQKWQRFLTLNIEKPLSSQRLTQLLNTSKQRPQTHSLNLTRLKLQR